MRSVFALLLIAWAGCGDTVPRTQVMVEIDAADELRPDIARVRVEVRGPRPGEPRVLEDSPGILQEFALAESDVDWPIRVALVPEGGDARRRYEATAFALDASGDTLTTARARSSFVERHTIVLQLFFYARCRDVICDPDSTCNTAGSCVPVPDVDACTLPTIDGTPSDCARDGGGAADARVDAAEDDGGAGPCFWDDVGTCDDPMRVVAGSSHACAVRASGDLVCWGNNGSGRLARDPTLAMSERPVEVALPEGPVTDVAAGSGHTCAIVDGGIWCWGEGSAGQLGPMAGAPGAPVPVMSPSGEAWSRVAAGTAYSCAVDALGAVFCWGRNAAGQLGRGTTGADQPTPEAVMVSDVVEIQAGFQFACARTMAGEIYCWGQNSNLQLGTDMPGPAGTPRQVPGIPLISALTTSGGSTCARATTGTDLWCWGHNNRGELGRDLFGGSHLPDRAMWAGGFGTVLGAGLTHVCATEDRTARLLCWGSDDYEEITGGPLGQRRVPAPITPELANVTSVAGGSGFTCAIADDRGLLCWGRNDFGQVGIGATSMMEPAPVPVLPPQS